jgi:hypothetical protein
VGGERLRKLRFYAIVNRLGVSYGDTQAPRLAIVLAGPSILVEPGGTTSRGGALGRRRGLSTTEFTGCRRLDGPWVVSAYGCCVGEKV